MVENIQITPFAKDVLTAKKREIEKFLKKTTAKKSESILDIKSSEKALEEVKNILEKAAVTEFSEKQPAVVLLGTKVVLENLSTGDLREYTIMSRSTSNPIKGVISNESPLAQKMLGLKLGNTFKYKDFSGSEETYKIKTIE